MSDGINSEVKFKSTNQSTYDNLAEKDPNSLYFTEDTQKIYKGNIQFSDGSLNEDRFVKVYELSEKEFWDKFNSGDLQIGQYFYLQPGLVHDDLPISIMYGNASGVASSDDMYYIMSYWQDNGQIAAEYNGGIITQASLDFNHIKSFKLRDMITDRSPSLPKTECLANNCIGCDNFGYLYMSAEDTHISNDGNVYNWGVVGVNTSKIDDSSQWNIINTFRTSTGSARETRMAFRPFNLITSYVSNNGRQDSNYNSVPDMYSDPLLITKEGGLFGFKFVNMYNYDMVREGCRIDIARDDGYRINYYKDGTCKDFKILQESGFIRQSNVGPRCFATNPDSDNKLYYLASPYAGSTDNIMVNSIDVDGTYQYYNIAIDDSTKSGFTSCEAQYASFIRCKNSKVFVFIGNTNPVCATLDLTTGEYTNVHKFTDFIFDAHQQYSTVSNIVEGENSICFTVFNGEVCQYVCWNYTEDKIYSVAKQVAAKGYERRYYNSSCDILRQGQANSIIAYSSNFNDRTVKIETLSCDNLSVLNTWTLDNVYEIDYGFAVAPIYELPDNKFLVLSYAVGTNINTLTAATIDLEGNIKYCSVMNNRGPGFLSNFNSSVVLPNSNENMYMVMKLSSDGLQDKASVIDLNNYNFGLCDLFPVDDDYRPLVINNTLLSVSYTSGRGSVSSSILSLSKGLGSYMVTNEKIQIINEGDITI